MGNFKEMIRLHTVFSHRSGKSLIYQMAPLVDKEIGQVQKPIVVPPLVVLVEDQVKEAGKLGLTVMELGGRNDNHIHNKCCLLVFGSPKIWLKDKWRTMLSCDVYQKNLVGIVVDKVINKRHV